jgi:hypothetical protein
VPWRKPPLLPLGRTNIVYGLLPSTQQENETIKAATVIGCGRISGL